MLLVSSGAVALGKNGHKQLDRRVAAAKEGIPEEIRKAAANKLKNPLAQDGVLSKGTVKPPENTLKPIKPNAKLVHPKK